MRIIGGKHQRRHIIAPTKLPVRPTTDMAKEALFNILNNHFDFEEVSVLDLFSGTGNISYEFASRGAKEVISVDANMQCVKFIKQTAENLNMDNIRAVKADVFQFLGFCKSRFDVIFADPPFDSEQIAQIPQMVFKADLLKPGAWLIVEHGGTESFNQHPNFIENRNYGKVHFSIFKVNSENKNNS